MTSLVDDLLMAATDCEGNRYGELLTKAAATVEELEKVKAELLGALVNLYGIAMDEGIVGDSTTLEAARAAIAKAKGE